MSLETDAINAKAVLSELKELIIGASSIMPAENNTLVMGIPFLETLVRKFIPLVGGLFSQLIEMATS